MRTISIEAISVNITGCSAHTVNLEIDMSDNQHASLLDTFSEKELDELLDIRDTPELCDIDTDELITELESRGLTILDD